MCVSSCERVNERFLPADTAALAGFGWLVGGQWLQRGKPANAGRPPLRSSQWLFTCARCWFLCFCRPCCGTGRSAYCCRRAFSFFFFCFPLMDRQWLMRGTKEGWREGGGRERNVHICFSFSSSLQFNCSVWFVKSTSLPLLQLHSNICTKVYPLAQNSTSMLGTLGTTGQPMCC